MFNYPGSPDPRIWARKVDLDAAFAKIKSLTEVVEILAKDLTFKIKFDSNGGSGTMSDMTLTGLGTATLTAGAFTPATGKTFAGWNTKADGTGTSYADGATVDYYDFKDVSGDVTLYAQWENAVYTIAYELDGGTNASGNPASYTYGTGVASFANPTKSGFAFGGWYSESTFTNVVTSVSTSETGDKTLYAKFTEE